MLASVWMGSTYSLRGITRSDPWPFTISESWTIVGRISFESRTPASSFLFLNFMKTTFEVKTLLPNESMRLRKEIQQMLPGVVIERLDPCIFNASIEDHDGAKALDELLEQAEAASTTTKYILV
jgi:hypothetical protein